MLTTLPNLLTLSRILFVPVVVALLFSTAPLASWAALAIFLVASVTDWVDGHIARRRQDTTALGRFLDPIADKLLIAAVLVMLVASGRIAGGAVVAAIVILCRELLVSGLREYLAETGAAMPVSKLAKWKTTVQMLALAILIVGSATPDALRLQPLGEVLLWLATLLTAVTGWDYLRRGLVLMNQPTGGQGSQL